MPTFERKTPVFLASSEACLSYLTELYNQVTAPFGYPYARVNITNRDGMPADVGLFNVGIQVLGPQEIPFDSLMVVTTDGNYTVITVRRGGTALRT